MVNLAISTHMCIMLAHACSSWTARLQFSASFEVLVQAICTRRVATTLTGWIVGPMGEMAYPWWSCCTEAQLNLLECWHVSGMEHSNDMTHILRHTDSDQKGDTIIELLWLLWNEFTISLHTSCDRGKGFHTQREHSHCNANENEYSFSDEKEGCVLGLCIVAFWGPWERESMSSTILLAHCIIRPSILWLFIDFADVCSSAGQGWCSLLTKPKNGQLEQEVWKCVSVHSLDFLHHQSFQAEAAYYRPDDCRNEWGCFAIPRFLDTWHLHVIFFFVLWPDALFQSFAALGWLFLWCLLSSNFVIYFAYIPSDHITSLVWSHAVKDLLSVDDFQPKRQLWSSNQSHWNWCRVTHDMIQNADQCCRNTVIKMSVICQREDRSYNEWSDEKALCAIKLFSSLRTNVMRPWGNSSLDRVSEKGIEVDICQPLRHQCEMMADMWFRRSVTRRKKSYRTKGAQKKSWLRTLVMDRQM